MISHRTFLLAALLALFVSLSAVLVPAVQAAEGGTVTGVLVNGSAAGGSVADVEVVLVTHFGHAERNRSISRTDQEGRFRFSDLAVDSSYSYEVTARYQEADYSARRVSFERSGEVRDISLTVYDATTLAEVVRATAKYYFLYPGEDALLVREALVLENSSDRSYVGSQEVGPGQRETGRYQPPEGAEKVSYGDGFMQCCIVQLDGGFADIMAIKPGETRRVYSYSIPYNGGSLAFKTTLQQPVDKVQILMPKSGPQLEVIGLNEDGIQHLIGEDYVAFGGDSLPEGSVLQLRLRELPVRGVGLRGLQPVIALIPVALMAVVIGWARLRAAACAASKRAASPTTKTTAGSSQDPSELSGEQGDLVAAIADLDDAYHAGTLGRELYEQMRAEKKARLIQVMRQSGLASPSSS